VLAPEERHGVESLVRAQHVASGNLALPLGNDPVLDANAFARIRIGPPRDVARGKNAGHARLQVLVHGDAVIHRQSGLFRNRQGGCDADPHDNEVAVERDAAAERHSPPVNPHHRLPQMEGDTVRLVERSNEPSHLDAHDVLERQGQVAARNMLGAHERFDAVPFFWSQHYDVAIRYVGHAERWDAVFIDGSLEALDCSVHYRRGGRTLATATIGRDRANLEAEVRMERDVATQGLP
jgi:hypothetical protein